MILLIGERNDPVIASLSTVLDGGGICYALLDATTATPDDLHTPPAGKLAPWRIFGNGCQGNRAVSAVFVRLARSIPLERVALAPRLWRKISRMLMAAHFPVMNRPEFGAGNYAKAHQLQQLAKAGLVVPQTVVTSLPHTALQFVIDHAGEVLTKGLCNAKTAPRVVGPEHLARIQSIRGCPVQLQEIVRGRELRLTVIGDRAISSVAKPGGGYRSTHAAEDLPSAVIQRCLAFVEAQGLLLGGFDLCTTNEDVVYCFEMNDYPQIAHYDDPQAPMLARAVVECLSAAGVATGEVLA
jgi:hypothetical protein